MVLESESLRVRVLLQTLIDSSGPPSHIFPHSHSIDDEGLSRVAKCPNLALLDLTSCRQVTNIDRVISDCPKLKTIALADCSSFDWPRFFDALASHETEVVKLDLAATSLTDAAFSGLSNANLKRLSHVSIHGCQGITDESFRSQGSIIRRILDQRNFEVDGEKFYLMMCDCNNVSKEALHQLRMDYGELSPESSQKLHLRCVKDLSGASGRTCSCSATSITETSD